MNLLIKTSNTEWLKTAIEAYSKKKAFTLLDDAKIGLTEKDLISAVTLIRVAKKKAGLPFKTIAQALTSIGITGAGIYIVILAIADPEPTSKLGLLITGGLILAVTGSLGALSSLGVKFSIAAKTFGGNEFFIRPE
jgi:hypothetical protein